MLETDCSVQNNLTDVKIKSFKLEKILIRLLIN